MATIQINGPNLERKPSNALDVGHKKSMVTGRKPSISPQSVGSGVGTSFQLIMSFHNIDTNETIAFKQDGQRFGTSQKTLKLYSNLKYKCVFKCKPQVEFHNLHLGGSDLELVSEHLHCNPGEYSAIWNTTGIDPTRKGARQDCLIVLSGPGISLRKKLQTKFYAPGDGHAEWGHKMDSMIWNCEIDPTGDILVTDEQVI